MYRVRRSCTNCGATWYYWNNAPEPCSQCKKRNKRYRCRGVKMGTTSESKSTLQCDGMMTLGMDSLLRCDKCERTARAE